jgi:hypothetical protein
MRRVPHMPSVPLDVQRNKTLVCRLVSVLG